MIQLTQTGIEASEADIAASRDEFSGTGCVMMRDFLAPPILRPLLSNLDQANYRETHEVSTKGRRFGTTMKIPASEPVLTVLYFVLNRQALFDIVEKITGCGHLGNYAGRIHRTCAGGDQHIDWHDDVYDFRMVGLNINLSRSPFRGGEFGLRDGNRQIRREISEWKAGDAFLFEVSPGWQHRVTPVTAGERTVGVGWFRTQPAWSSLTVSQFRGGVISLLAEAEK